MSSTGNTASADPSALRFDIVAGLTVAAVVLPKVMTHATLAVCVAIHAIGITSLLSRLNGSVHLAGRRFWPLTLNLIKVAGQLVLLHLLEICLWALYYLLGLAMPDLASALYFSSVTYTTTGYGDLVLPERWRLVGGIEALTGILMCGWSTGFFFMLVSRIDHEQHERMAAPGPKS